MEIEQKQDERELDENQEIERDVDRGKGHSLSICP